MITALIIISKIILIACVFVALAMVYWCGLRRGVEIIARVELKEANPDVLTIPDVWRDYVREVRGEVQVAENDAAYHYWRTANKLPDGTVTRELFRDKLYRNALRSQN